MAVRSTGRPVRGRHGPTLVGLSCISAAFSGSALAQTPNDTPATPAADPVRVEEVIVTARKREESLQDTPVAVTAVSAKALESQSIASLDDVSNSVPNVSFTGGSGDSGVGSAVIFIRGIGQTDYANSTEPGVGTYIDGVYIGRSIGGLLELPGVEQIEVLRGPQGTLFGKNTMGGAINITTRQPSFTNNGSIAITAGEDSRFNLDADADLRLSDVLGARLSLATRDQDGFVERLNGGESTGAEEVRVGRLSLAYEPNDRLRMLLSADFSDIGGTTPRVVTNINPNNELAAAWNAIFATDQLVSNEYSTSDLRSTNATGSFDNSYEGGGVALRVESVLKPELTLRSITAGRGFEAFSEADQDGQSIDWGFVKYEDEQTQFSQEFNLLGEAFGGRMDWLAGAYYFTEDADATQRIDLANPIVLLTNNFTTETESYAVFGEVSWAFTERLTASLGGRFTRDEKDFFAETFCRPGTPDPFGTCAANYPYYLVPTTTAESWDSFDPRVGLQFKPSQESLLYATYSTGFKSGGFNSRANSPEEVEAYDPETVDAIELGAKASFAERRVQIAAAVFHYDYEDLQVTVTGTDDSSGTPISQAIVGNVGSAEVQGFEVEAFLRPTRLLSLNFAAGYLDGEYTELDDELLGLLLDSGSPIITLDNELPKTPEWTFNAGAELTTPILTRGDIAWRLDYAFVDDQYSEIQNFEATLSPDHYNLNGRITYTPTSERWSFAIYGKNITDEVYVVNGFIPDGGNGAQTFIIPNEPREIGATVKVNFGG